MDKNERISPRSDKYILPERRTSREVMQDGCPHEHFHVVCSTCLKVLGSEVTHTHDPERRPDEIFL